MRSSRLDDPSPEEMLRILRESLAFARRHAVGDDKMDELRADPDAVSLVNRYHGERYDLPQRLLPQAARGRGACARCSHAVYFDDRPGFVGPVRKVCLVCLLDEAAGHGAAAAASKARATLWLACPSWCPWLRGRQRA